MKDIKRKNGYLDLDRYYQEMIEKNNSYPQKLYKDKIIEESSYKAFHFWLNIKGNKYYFKSTPYGLNELIVYYLASKVGLNALKYDLAIFKGGLGVISKDFRKESASYHTMNEILKEYSQNNLSMFYNLGLNPNAVNPHLYDMTNLLAFWEALENRYKNEAAFNCEKMLNELVKRYMFNILIKNHDDFSENFVIEEKKDENGNIINVSFVPIFDSELFLSEKSRIGLAVDYDDSSKNSYESLEYFLKVSDEKYIKMFLELFEKLDASALDEALENIEDQIGFSIYSLIDDDIYEKLVDDYNENREHILEVLKRLSIIDERRKI